MNADLDVIEAVKLTLAAIDKLVEHALRTSGSVEAQEAARLTQRRRPARPAPARLPVPRSPLHPDRRHRPTKNGEDRWVDVGHDLGALLDRLKADRPGSPSSSGGGARSPRGPSSRASAPCSTRTPSGGTSPACSGSPAWTAPASPRTAAGTRLPAGTSPGSAAPSGSSSSWVTARARSHSTSRFAPPTLNRSG